jgi:hypothetical protein
MMDKSDRAAYQAIKAEIDKATDLTNDPQVQRAAYERACDLVDQSPWRAAWNLPGDLDERFKKAMGGKK